MARKGVLDNIDKITKDANLQEKERSPKKVSKMKAKVIHIDENWEEAIKEYQGGTITAYIRLAIREKMKRDGII